MTRDPEAIVRRMLADLETPRRAEPGTEKENTMPTEPTIGDAFRDAQAHVDNALDIDPGPKLEVEVHELEDDSDMLVTGTTDEALARRLVEQRIRENYAGDDPQAQHQLTAMLDALTHATVSAGRWFETHAPGHEDEPVYLRTDAPLSSASGMIVADHAEPGFWFDITPDFD